MRIENWPTEKVKPYKNNPRKNDKAFDAVSESIKQFGFRACEKNGRKCRMIEIDPKYCDVIIERWQQFTGGKAIRV